MDLTTLERVKAYMSAGGVELAADLDAILQDWITALSLNAQRWMDRTTEAGPQTEVHDVYPFQQIVYLNAWPVTAVESVTLDGNVLGEDQRTLDLARGRVYLNGGNIAGSFQGLEVKYTGGMAEDTYDFVIAYPEVARAIDMMVAEAYRRKDAAGSASVSLEGGSIGFIEALEWLPMAEQLMRPHRRETYV